ncbi:MAG: hypothetical protein KF820_04905 [Candidatus Paracaedibacteraceae bacterium]|nr:hypothetical protein [Candidatus Paracaedibacteraceae bacterium]
MSKLLLLTVFTLFLGQEAFADTAKQEEAKTETAKKNEPKAEESKSRDEKKAEKKAERAHKVLEKCEASLKESEEKGKALTGSDKKMFDLFVAHAKLEMEAAKDVDMKDHALSHARHCKRFMANAHKYLKSESKEQAKSEEKK